MSIRVSYGYIESLPAACQIFKGRLVLRHTSQYVEHIWVGPEVSLSAIKTHDVDMVLGSKDNLAISSLSASSADILESAPRNQL